MSGFESVVEKFKTDDGKLELLKIIGRLLHETNDLDFGINDEIRVVIFPVEENTGVDAESFAKAEEFVSDLVASDKRGAELASCCDPSSLIPSFGSMFLKKLLSLKPELIKHKDQEWLDMSQYGELLSLLIYSDEPDDLQAEVLLEIQKAFLSIDFPRDEKRIALLEKAFVKLYDNDIVSPDAIIAWKDDLAETPGKLKAILQVSEFVKHIEFDDDEEDEEEE